MNAPVPTPPRSQPPLTKGSLWLVNADPTKPPIGTEIWPDRPAVIVSNNISNARSGFVSVVYLSTSSRKRPSPVHVRLPAGKGRKASIALCEQIHTVDTSRLSRPMGRLTNKQITQIDDALRISLALSDHDGSRSLFRKWENYIRKYGIDMKAETEALLEHTSNERIIAYERAVETMSRQLDAYRILLCAKDELAEALGEVNQTLDSGSPEPKNKEVA